MPLRFSIPLAAAAAALFAPLLVAGDAGRTIVIADQFNNRVIEVDVNTHKIVWQFGNGSDQPGPNSVVGPNDAERFGRFTLISGTGIPAASPPLPGCSTPSTGCADNRVFVVDQGGHIIWQYGQAGVAASGPDQLNTPVQAIVVSTFPGHPGPHILITDQANERVILVNVAHQIEWQYGMTGTSGSGANQLNSPNSAEVVGNGHVLIADQGNNRAIEVTTGGQIEKTFTIGGTANTVAFASRLPNGDTLLTDSGNNRIAEVNAHDGIVWEYFTNMQKGSNPNPQPTRAVRLANGNTLISDQFNNRVLEVNPDKQIVFQQGSFTAGDGFNQLNGPYDAKETGDFTGLTPPF